MHASTLARTHNALTQRSGHHEPAQPRTWARPTPHAVFRGQFTAKHSALYQHTHDCDKAVVRDMQQTAASIEELVPMLTKFIELCRHRPGELSRELASVSTLHAGVIKGVAL